MTRDGAFAAALSGATFRGQLGPTATTDGPLMPALFLIPVADFVRVEPQISGTRQAWCYLQDDGSWAPIPRIESLPLAVIQQWLFPLNAEAKVIAAYSAIYHVYFRGSRGPPFLGTGEGAAFLLWGWYRKICGGLISQYA